MARRWGRTARDIALPLAGVRVGICSVSRCMRFLLSVVNKDRDVGFVHNLFGIVY